MALAASHSGSPLTQETRGSEPAGIQMAENTPETRFNNTLLLAGVTTSCRPANPITRMSARAIGLILVGRRSNQITPAPRRIPRVDSRDCVADSPNANA